MLFRIIIVYRSRLRPNIRPLRPGLRLNFGGKGSSTTASQSPSTTQAPIVESSPVEIEEKVCPKLYNIYYFSILLKKKCLNLF